MERERQEVNPEPRGVTESDREESRQTRRSFLKRSAGLLVYVAPLIETFNVDDAEAAGSSGGGGRRRARGRVSPGALPPPPPPPTPGDDDDDDDDSWF